MSAEAGPSSRKRRKLLFTSELSRAAIERYDEQGNETVEWLQYQSAQRLKAKWESIFERFKDAHLQDQDELYLGNVANGEPLVVIKDRGSLRALERTMNFGDFIKDEELQGWKSRPEASTETAPGHDDQWHIGSEDVESDDERSEDPADNDPDLREFLEAEARRKALHAEQHLDDEEDDVIDLNDPSWAEKTQSSPSRVWKPPRLDAPPPKRPAQKRTPASSSSSDDDDQADAITVYSDSDDELDDSTLTKRQNIEDLLHCTTPFNTLPYNDVFGLADLLGLPGHTSRLYVDFV